MNVYLILSENGAEGQDFRATELFKRSLAMGLVSQPESSEDRPVSAEEDQGSTEELLLHIRGMWCTSCAWLIEYALAKLPGIAGVEA